MSIRILLAGFSIGSGTALAQAPAKPGTIREARADEIVTTPSTPALVPVARAASPDDTGYEQYLANNPQLTAPANGQYPNPGNTAPQNDSTMVGRAWSNVKKWVNDRGTNFSKSFSDNGNAADSSLMPLSPATMPQYANGQNGQRGPGGQSPQNGQFQPNGQYGQMNRNAPAANPYAFNNQQSVQPYARSPQSPQPYGGGPVMAGPQGTGVPPAQLAGRPAYNWYGYGSAPPSGFPQGSTNWMNQTGATPGAFPVTGQPVIPKPVSFGGPRAVSTIPTIPTPTIPPPMANPVATSAPANPGAATPNTTPEFKTIPTVTPPPVVNSAPTMPIQPAPSASPASPRFDEPEWQPATTPRVELSSGNAGTGQVVHASGTIDNDAEPTWQTAKVTTPRLLPVPTQPNDRTPAELPMPIPTVNLEIPVPVQAQIPVTETAPKLLPVPTVTATVPTVQQQQPYRVPLNPAAVPANLAAGMEPTMASPTASTMPAPISSAPWQPIAKPIARPTATNPQAYALSNPNANPNFNAAAQQTTWNSSQSLPAQSTTGRVIPRNPTTQQPQRTPATNVAINPQTANGLAPPPPDAPTPQLIPVNASREILELERQIRAASIRFATVLEVQDAGPQKLLVKFVAKTEQAAQDAAQAISQLPILRPYTVDFEVRLANR